MNEFYHAFSVGFNWWYVVLPALTVLMGLYGSTNLKLEEGSLKILRRDKNNYLLTGVVIGADILLHWLILKESTAGILQFLMNHLSPNDDIFWALILFIIGMTGTTICVYVLFFQAAKFGQRLKRRYLKKLRREMRMADLGL